MSQEKTEFQIELYDDKYNKNLINKCEGIMVMKRDFLNSLEKKMGIVTVMLGRILDKLEFKDEGEMLGSGLLFMINDQVREFRTLGEKQVVMNKCTSRFSLGTFMSNVESFVEDIVLLANADKLKDLIALSNSFFSCEKSIGNVYEDLLGLTKGMHRVVRDKIFSIITFYSSID